MFRKLPQDRADALLLKKKGGGGGDEKRERRSKGERRAGRLRCHSPEQMAVGSGDGQAGATETPQDAEASPNSV